MAAPSHYEQRHNSLTFRDLLPLVGYLVPTVVTAYGVVMPRHGIAGVNELTVGFASAVFGAGLTYVLGLRAALARRATGREASRWRRPQWIARQSARPRGIAGWFLGHIMRAETATANDLAVQLADIAPDAEVLDVGCGPGVLKNGIDWLIGSGELEQKVVAITSAVAGPERGKRGLEALRVTLSAVSATIVGGEPIPKGPELESHVAALVRSLVEAATKRDVVKGS
jgi:hypothetical protein